MVNVNITQALLRKKIHNDVVSYFAYQTMLQRGILWQEPYHHLEYYQNRIFIIPCDCFQGGTYYSQQTVECFCRKNRLAYLSAIFPFILKPRYTTQQRHYWQAPGPPENTKDIKPTIKMGKNMVVAQNILYS